MQDWSAAAQRPGEPGERHRWLRLYLAMHPADRHLAEVARVVGAAYGTVRKTSARWEWRQRATAWDREQKQSQGIVLREVATVGLSRVGNAARQHATSLERYVATPTAMTAPERTAAALKSTASALREVADYGAELESAQELDLDLREVAEADPQAAAARALVAVLAAPGARVADKIQAARALHSMPVPEGLGVDAVFALLARVQGRLSSPAAAELSQVVAQEATGGTE